MTGIILSLLICLTPSEVLHASVFKKKESLSPAKATKPRPLYSFTSFPCEVQEKWEFSKNIPRAWSPRMMVTPGDIRSTLTTLLLSDVFRDNSTTQEQALLSEYWIWRSFYQLSFTHVAVQGFNEVIKKATESASRGVQLAAIACLNKINKKYPTLTLSADATNSMSPTTMSQILSTKKQPIWEAITRGLKLRLARRTEFNPADLSLQKDKNLLLGSGPYNSFIQTLLAMKTISEPEILKNGELFLNKIPTKQHGILEQEDPIRLILAKSYYDQGLYEKSLEISKEIRSGSDYFPDSLITRSWSQVSLRNYGDAVGSAQNFLIGGYSHLFSPESNLIVAMSLTETCRYLHAIESIQFFQKSYLGSYVWLKKWVKSQPDLYSVLLDYLNKKQKLPKKIASHWIKSPILMANQRELNLITKENKKVSTLINQLSQLITTKRDVRWISALQRMQHTIHQTMSQLSRTREILISEINEDLKQRTLQMVEELQDVSDQIQLIEVEAYSKVGDKLIAENMLNKAFLENPQQGADGLVARKLSSRPAPVWDWGEMAMTYREDSNPEIWEDELGFLKSKMFNQCNHHRLSSL